MKNKTDFAIGIIILIFCAVMGHQISLIPENTSDRFFNPYTLPILVTSSLAVLASILILKSLWYTENNSTWPEASIMKRIISMSALIIAYVFTFIHLGDYAYNALWPMGSVFAITTFLFLCFAQASCGQRNALRIIIISFIYTLMCYLAFGLFFNVPLP